MNLHRRDFLALGVFGGASLALRSILSGIPAAILANPRLGFAQSAQTNLSSARPTFLIYATSLAGDPVNCNVPGTYDDPTIFHADDPAMAPTAFNLGTSQVLGARVWSSLDSSTLAKTCFFHHSTYTSVHPDEGKVLRVLGRTAKNEMLVSVVSKQNQVSLGTIQGAPVTVSGGNEQIYYGGSPQHTYTPAQLSLIFQTPSLGPKQLQNLRDTTVDSLNAWLRINGTPSQQQLIDSFVLSQQQARQVPDNLMSALAGLKDNTVASQVQAALVLFQMKITPAAVIHIGFGNDNHSDPNLATEVAEHISGVAAINAMMVKIREAGMEDRVSFCMQNVFGRGFSTENLDGRDHNSQHHVSVMIGPNVRGGIVGGLSRVSPTKYSAQAIDSGSGAGGGSGDIAYADTFSAQAKTLCAINGVPMDSIESLIMGGSIVRSALATST